MHPAAALELAELRSSRKDSQGLLVKVFPPLPLSLSASVTVTVTVVFISKSSSIECSPCCSVSWQLVDGQGAGLELNIIIVVDGQGAGLQLNLNHCSCSAWLLACRGHAAHLIWRVMRAMCALLPVCRSMTSARGCS